MKQRGFSIMGLLVVMGFTTVFFTIISERLVATKVREYQAEPFKKKLEQIRNQVDNFQVGKFQSNPKFDPNSKYLFPQNLDTELISQKLWASCNTTNEAKGLCSMPLSTPYGEKMTWHLLTTASTGYYGELRIPLPNKADNPVLYNVYLSTLTKLPGTTLNTAETQLTFRINRISDQPAYEEGMMALARKEFVALSGDVPLKADWDVSGTGSARALVNAADYTIRLQNGKQQRLGEGIVGYLVGYNNLKVTKHSCAVGLEPDLIVSVKDLQAFSTVREYSSSGAFQVGHEPSGSDWKLYIKHNVKLQSTNKWALINDGYLNVMRVCRRNATEH